MADNSATPAGGAEPERRIPKVLFTSWTAFLICIAVFALWLSLTRVPTTAAPAAAATFPPKLKIGSLAPDFTLPDHEGKTHQLRDALKQGPVLLVFYLQLSCRHCAALLQNLGEAQERFARSQVTLFGISPDSPQFTKEALEDFGPVPFPLLSDEDHHVAKSYGVYQDGEKPLMLHGVFLIGQDGRVRFMETGEEAYMDVEELERQAEKAGVKP